jgi:wyosine [tRNA(Phe)-imidazoG37] synthetase (radical SAM superfamily)
MERVLAELREKLRVEPRPDFIGLAGSGEPTLHSRIAEIVAELKRLTRVPVAALTNGSMLYRPEVRAALAEADLVMPSLDAGSRSSFERANRPHADISFERLVGGLVTFSRGFKGKIWLEVLILAGITDQRAEVGRIAAIVDKMRVDRVQLNTVARPAADASALAVSREDLEKLRGLFTCPCEVIAENCLSQRVRSPGSENAEDQIVALVSRRPCTVEGIATGLGLRPNEVLKRLEVLCATGTLRAERRDEAVFYEGVRNRGA